jgi:cob(I)alamin adenosyltransferase
MNTKGYIHLYTGDGKGKTTAALGLAMRACGAGKKVFIGQFVKGKHYSEITTIQNHLPCIELKQYGLDCFIVNDPEQKDSDAARQGLDEVKAILLSCEYDLVILDELNIALHYNLFPLEEVLEMLRNKAPQIEIVITGRYAPKEIYDVADLITEMKEIKHYYTEGIEARIGIEF